MNCNVLLQKILEEQKQTNEWLKYIAGHRQLNESSEIANEALEAKTRESAEMFLFTSLVTCRGMTVHETREYLMEHFKREQVSLAVQSLVKELFDMEVEYSTFNPPRLNILTGKEEQE